MQRTVETLPQLGWSTPVNIVGVALVFFYLPPDTSDLPDLITSVTFLGFLNAIGVVSFAMLTTLGRDVADDLGVRLSGLIGFSLCLTAGIVFLRYDGAGVTGGQRG